MATRRTTGAVVAVATVLALLAPPAGAAPSDPYFSRQWGLALVEAENAWATSTGAGVTIAIVDTGVDLVHPDLAGKIIAGVDLTESDPNGPQDESGHGTHVAGIAAAITGNAIGVAGVAPGAQILPVRVIGDDGGGSVKNVAQGIRHAAAVGARVINVSISFSRIDHELDAMVNGTARPIHEAIEEAWAKGAVVVVAAGNNSSPLCGRVAGAPHAVCVGATDSRDLRVYYSNSDAAMGKHYLVAPGGDDLSGCGGDVFSTYLSTMPPSSCSPEAGYNAMSGTSMAAPFVSGVAALLAAKGLTNSEIVACLNSTADDLGAPGRDPIYGWGRVNAYSAVIGC